MARAKKPTAKKPTAKTKTKTKIGRQGAKSAKTTAKKKPAAKKATAVPKKPAPARRAAKKPAPRSRVRTGPTSERVTIGEITAPSGKIAIFDIGLVGYLPREALEPAMIITKVPAHQVLPLVGQRLGKGRFADCWDSVSVVVGEGEIATSTKLGEAGVDFARLIAIDLDALDAWRHEDSLDGRADFVFWGRDAGLLAKAMRAPSTKEGHGWTDLPLPEAEAKADQAGRLKAQNHWLLATDFRPHSHHFHALAAARRSSHGAGVIDVGRTRACLFFTSWGDGVFPVYLDADADGRPVQIRVQLATPETLAAMHAVNS